MTVAKIRSVLAPVLRESGFARRGAALVLRQGELEHAISIHAVRRLAGFFEIVHSISLPGAGSDAWIQCRIGGFAEPYLEAWAVEKFDAALAAMQIDAIVQAFSSTDDIAHFYSDRPPPEGFPVMASEQEAGTLHSLSQAEENALLHHHSNAVFAGHFTPASRLEKGMWTHGREVGGYRYFAYLAPTETATFATVMYFPFASQDVGMGSKRRDVMRSLYAVRKRLLADGEQPVLIRLAERNFDHSRVAALLERVFAASPPNEIPRRGD